jgi:hypothetical protein
VNLLPGWVGEYMPAHPGAQLDQLEEEVVSQTTDEPVWDFFRTSVRSTIGDVLRYDFNRGGDKSDRLRGNARTRLTIMSASSSSLRRADSPASA